MRWGFLVLIYLSCCINSLINNRKVVMRKILSYYTNAEPPQLPLPLPSQPSLFRANCFAKFNCFSWEAAISKTWQTQLSIFEKFQKVLKIKIKFKDTKKTPATPMNKHFNKAHKYEDTIHTAQSYTTLKVTSLNKNFQVDRQTIIYTIMWNPYPSVWLQRKQTKSKENKQKRKT